MSTKPRRRFLGRFRRAHDTRPVSPEPSSAPSGSDDSRPGAAPPDAEAERQAVTRRTGVVLLGTLGSRLSGAVRDAVIAASFPLASTDAFFVAWTIPNTLRGLLGEGGVHAAFVPVFSDLDERDGRARARQYFQRFFGALLCIATLVAVVGVLTAPLWATFYAAGYRGDTAKFTTTTQLTAVVFPYVVFAGVAALQAGVLNALGRFFTASLAPALLNLSLIAAPFLLVPVAVALGQPPVMALAYGALAGGALQVLSQVPAMRRAGVAAWPRFDFADPAVRRSFVLLAPLLLGTGVHQLTILSSRLLASFLDDGAQSFLYYGQRLIEIPQGMFAIAIASAALPSLARMKSRGENDEAKATLRHALRLSLFVAVPSSVALAALAMPIVTVVFARGAFGQDEVAGTAGALFWMALGVWAVAAVHPVVRAFYAYSDTRTPVLCSAVNLLVFFSVSLACMDTLAHEAIALASSVASFAQLALLAVLLRRRLGPLGVGEVARAFARCSVASGAMALTAHTVARLGRWERGGNDPLNLAVTAAAVGLGVLAYLGASRALRSAELSEVMASLRGRGRRVASGATDASGAR